jgi:Myosin head (motor domain)
MSTVRIDEALQKDIFRIVSAVLWLGNVTFVAKNDDETRVNMDEAFNNVSELLGVPPERLVFALTHRLMTVGNETYEKTLNLEKSVDTRDALAKALFAAVFSLIVDRINSSLASEKRLSGKFISILDIYGFESFKKNSFEQLCINYANERLQQQFNKHLFKLEQVLLPCFPEFSAAPAYADVHPQYMHPVFPAILQGCVLIMWWLSCSSCVSLQALLPVLLGFPLLYTSFPGATVALFGEHARNAVRLTAVSGTARH